MLQKSKGVQSNMCLTFNTMHVPENYVKWNIMVLDAWLTKFEKGFEVLRHV